MTFDLDSGQIRECPSGLVFRMNQFEQLLLELKAGVDPNNVGQDQLQQALNQGQYTINPRFIANQWLKQSFYTCQEACLQD